MHDWLRKVLVALLVAVFTLYAYAPILRAGFVGEDLGTVAELERSVQDGLLPDGPEELYELASADARPVAALSLRASADRWLSGGATGPRDAGAARAFRAENLALLFLAALGVSGLLRRTLAPWFDVDQAKSAGIAAGILLLLHPLCVATVARVDARGDLIAAALGAWCLRLFLRGRQEGRYAAVAGACLLAFLAAASSELAVFLPPLCAVLEYASARRHRPRLVRLRTATTTFLVLGVCVALEWGGRWAFAAPAQRGVLPVGFGPDSLALGVEKLGVLFVPVNTYGIGLMGHALAGIAVLLALHPGFVAARSAPRLWGRILVGWVLAIVATEALEPAARVLPESLAGAQVLFPGALVMAVGLGVTSTAVSGARRSALPATIAFLYALLGHAAAVPLEEASAELESLRARLASEASTRRWSSDFLVIDPPGTVAGVDVVVPALPYLFEPAFLPAGAPESARERTVRGASLDAFEAWLREPEFTAWRERGAVVLFPASVLAGASGDALVAVDLPRPEPTEGRSLWRQEGRSPAGLVLESLRARWIEVVALPGTKTADPPVVRWSASSSVANVEEVVGAWVESPAGPIAVFDLERSLPWLLGDRIRSVWFTGVLNAISSAQVREGPPALAGDPVPRPVANDWLFDVGTEPPLLPAAGEAAWVLGLFDLGALRYEELAVRVEPGGRLRAVDAAARAASSTTGPVVWSLDYRVDGVTVARASGRRPRPDAE